MLTSFQAGKKIEFKKLGKGNILELPAKEPDKKKRRIQ